MKSTSTKAIISELENLRQKLEEANDTIEAIRTGQVDAFVVKDKNGPRLYTLKSADQTYRVFIEKMIEGAITLNPKGIILYCNSRFAAMLNLPISKIIGTYFKNYISPKSIITYQSLIKKGWKEECKGEILLMKGKTKTVPALVSLTTLELDEGNALSIILTDLTSQKNIEKELRKKNQQLAASRAFTEKLNSELEERVNMRTDELMASRKYFEFLADTIPVIVWRASPDGNSDYFNRQWFEYTGLSYEESKNLGWQKIIHPDDVKKSIAEWNISMRSGKPLNVECRKKSIHGNYRWHLAKALPFKDRTGKIIAWFGVSTDIDDHKKELKKKDEFISMASHELKTPVTTLKAYTQIMMMGQKGKNSHGENVILGKMDNQIDKLTRLIGDLLDVSKADTGHLQFSFEEIDFNEMVKDVAGMMQPTSLTHKIEVNLTENCIIYGDKNRLDQVIINLLSNAIKYSPHAKRVEISSIKSPDSIQLCVEDFGIGIPASQQSKLFSRFFRVSDSTFPGLGLGLYISNEIIIRHSGTMNFKSEEGNGSVFCFTLPVLKK